MTRALPGSGEEWKMLLGSVRVHWSPATSPTEIWETWDEGYLLLRGTNDGGLEVENHRHEPIVTRETKQKPFYWSFK